MIDLKQGFEGGDKNVGKSCGEDGSEDGIG